MWTTSGTVDPVLYADRLNSFRQRTFGLVWRSSATSGAKPVADQRRDSAALVTSNGTGSRKLPGSDSGCGQLGSWC